MMRPALSFKDALDMSFVAPRAAAWLLASCLAAVAALPAQAADKPKKEGTLGKAKPGQPMLTKEQLRACLAQNERIKKQIADTVPLQDGLKKEGEELAQAGDALKAERPTLDTTNEAAVNGFNERIAARDKAVEAYKARAEDYNTKVEALQADKAKYQKDCDGRSYFEDEAAQIKSGK